MSQYALPLALEPHFTRENFITAPCNEEALHWIDAWPQWPSRALWLSGPSGCGKTHLATLWRAASGAGVLHASALASHQPQAGHWLIEDVTKETDAHALFHWLNYTREEGGTLLLTSRENPQQLEFALKDVNSRLRALPVAALGAPDDAVLEGALRKQCIDRQLALEEDAIAYILARMERSLSQVRTIIERIDHAALAQKKRPTVPLVRQVLESLESQG